jgi:ribosomal protein S18 acetylase RimI-like enzyme
MFRPAQPADTPALLAMTAATNVFKPMEVDTLKEVLDDYHAYEAAAGARCFVLEQHDELVGFEYHATEPMTDGTWALWWIVVKPHTQGRGLGARLLKHAEDDARTHGARVFFIETSGLPQYEPTRRFYLKYGYEQEARLRDYYAAGDDQVLFRKAL